MHPVFFFAPLWFGGAVILLWLSFNPMRETTVPDWAALGLSIWLMFISFVGVAAGVADHIRGAIAQ